MPDRDWRILVGDMLDQAQRAHQRVAGRDYASFLQDDVLQDAVIRCLEIIGEAARYVPDEVRAKAPEMPWAAIVATRHILAHHYSRVDLEAVWRVASERLPATIESLRKLLASE